jgi:hypothetical protein
MNFAVMEKIADAVLYEGYILYPYRPTSIKNRQRWNFGTLFPRAFAEARSPNEACSFRAELLVEGTEQSRISARIRFLQIVPAETHDGDGWDEGFTRSHTLESIGLNEIADGVERTFDLASPSTEERERAPASFREIPMVGTLVLHAEKLRDGLYRLSATFTNETPMRSAKEASRRMAQASAFTSAHLLMHVEAGDFVSLLEPRPEVEADVAACKNQGVFPVLAGEAGDRSRVLCSPIILYDYPQIAPESAGDFFDGTEMDEMLALRVLTLTDDEKAEMRRSDPHARAILDRTETLPKEHLMKVHGAVRGMRAVPADEAPSEVDGVIDPWNPFEEKPPLEAVRVFGVEVRTGDRVRLWPTKKADIMDMAMKGKVAIVEAIEQDFEDNVQFAVVLEDDPGKDMGMLRQAGHRFFFSPDEIEPLKMEVL